MQSKKAYELVTTGKAGVPGIPARDGFNGFLRDLPGDRACLSPSLSGHPQSLTPASRRQDHTTSPSAFSTVRQRCLIASIASRPASVTIASAPSWDEIRKVFRLGEERKYFSIR